MVCTSFGEGWLQSCTDVLCAVLALMHRLSVHAAAVLVKQLLDAGASASEPEGILDMQPLHLACLGRLDTADDVSCAFIGCC